VPTFAYVSRAAVVTGAVLAVFALDGSVVVALAVAAVTGWVQGPVFALTAVRAMALRPEAAGRIGSVIMAANQAGALALPALAGMVVTQGRGATISILIGASLLLAVLARIAVRSGERPASSLMLESRGKV
jgi:predicted MFS family arabinose efflux permease